MTTSEMDVTRQSNGTTPEVEMVETDLLIVGAGPAGASLACFLAQHGECKNPFQHISMLNIPRSERNYARLHAFHS
jgi:hypothetical protein